MKTLLLFVLVVLGTSQAIESSNNHAEWESFKLNHGKKYSSPGEELMRKKVFFSNLDFIKEHNTKYENGEISFKVGVNEFADMTNEEFRAKMMHPIDLNSLSPADSVFQLPEHLDDLPDSVDWRTQGAVTEVKNQGNCGSCWTFSTVASLEGQHFLKTGQLVSLSEQNLLDCVHTHWSRGCNGGFMSDAFDYIRNNSGIDTEASYPYTGQDFGKCQYNPDNKAATVTGYVNVTSGSEDALKAAVATVGPISVAIDAGYLSFQLYHSGIYRNYICSKKYLNHAVTAVGYGYQKGVWIWSGDYWLVKNSWGKKWGENGYIKMGRNHKNMCGIATMASYPLV